MSAGVPNVPVPETVDAWRMVASRRGIEACVPLERFERLRSLLLDAEGEVAFTLDFGRDELQVPYVELHVTGGLPLQCQRSLERFVLPIDLTQRLGLVRSEAEEAALPPGYEALEVPADDLLAPLDIVEDELILAVPVIPVKPGSEAVERDWPAPVEEQERANPFAALAELKNKTPGKPD